jgi:ATP-dependent helicase HrpB
VVATEIAEVEGRKLEVLLRQVTRVEEDLLQDLYPGDFHDRDEVLYDKTSKRVVTRRERCWRDLVLTSKTVQEAPRDKAAELLAAEVMAGRIALPGWDGGVERWVARLNGLAAWMPELELPTFGDEDKALVVHQVCEGALGAKDLKNRKVAPVLKQWLSKAQRAALDAYAPDQVVLENGRKARVQYAPGREPEIRLLIQQLYDVRRHPCIADGRVPVVVVLLAPNQRPAQMTSDLAGFWENGYPEVKKQLKGRYPKHEWR